MLRFWRLVVKHPVGAGIVALAVLIAVAGSLTAGTPSDSAATVRLHDVTPERLAANGIHLVPPRAGEHAAVPIRAAEATAATRGRPDGTTKIREVVLAHVVIDGSGIDRLCWVVSLDPTGWFHSHGPLNRQPVVATWFLVFVDASSGQWLASDAGD